MHPFPVLTSTVATAPTTARPVILIGFLDQGNLGIGYLSATLRRAGYSVQVLDVEQPAEQILAYVSQCEPIVVGFSLIFQFYLPKYAHLITLLRENGVNCHFTMGGHFPTLSSTETLKAIPELDSVVRYEGEQTLLELAACLDRGDEWRHLEGIAHREGTNASRHLAEDLDLLPYPDRNFEPESILGRKAMPILASRGCARTCSFCSIHTFYRSAPGKVVRTRKPSEVVKEMSVLHRERDIRIFLFQDDDFPLFGPVWKKWTREFLAELHKARLPGRVIWKINCRADAVDEELFAEMKAAGLYLVYMGLESGTEEGLQTLNKKITVEQNIRAVETLKRLGIMYEFGFMMFDPSTSFESVEENLNFLEAITGDGSAAAVFCRMLPYDGTPIKDELARTGRLRGDVCNPDYDFLDDRIEHFYNALNRAMNITGWIHGHRSISPRLNWAWNEAAVMERLFPGVEELEEYREQLRAITQKTNRVLFEFVRGTGRAFSHGIPPAMDAVQLSSYCDQVVPELQYERDRFIARNQATMLEELMPAA